MAITQSTSLKVKNKDRTLCYQSIYIAGVKSYFLVMCHFNMCFAAVIIVVLLYVLNE
jgi:hypothetical protein